MAVVEFNEKEQYWINNMLKGEAILEAFKDSKSDTWITEGYLNYLDLMIKYGNLRIPDTEYVETPRVIRVHKKIPKALLDTGNYAYTIFNGLYVVQKVVFVRAENVGALLDKKLNDNPKLDENKLLLSSFKLVRFEDGSQWAIFLVKSGFTDRYLNFYSTAWDYSYIYDDEMD